MCESCLNFEQHELLKHVTTNNCKELESMIYPQLYPSSFWMDVMYSCCSAESGGRDLSISISDLFHRNHKMIQLY